MMNKRLVQSFLKSKEEHPDWGDIVILNNLVIGKKYGKMEIAYVLDHEVSKEDYANEDRDKILNSIFSLTSHSR